MVQAKAVNKILNVELVEKMLQHFETYNFIKTFNSKSIQFSFLTESLKEFVRKEWLQANVVATDWPTFLINVANTNESLQTNWESVKTFVGAAPFSIVEICNFNIETKEEEATSLKESNPTTAVQLVSNQFKNQTGTILKNQTFCPPENAVQIFYKKQRERKNWWRKFSAFPGRFVTTNVNNRENDKSTVCEIQAEFPWGLETVETITCSTDFNVTNNSCFEVNISKRKKCPPLVVTCQAVLENMAFTYLCDSYEKLNGDCDRNVLMLDRKLAPFKVAIAGAGSTSEAVKSLEEISLLMAKQVRKLGISVLLLPDACTTAIEKQVLRNDALGVPYTLLSNDDTAQVGSVSLRSRNTTLQEDSHVSVVAEYLGKILL